MSGQLHRGHLAVLAGWPARYVCSTHHLSFTMIEFFKGKCYQKVPVSAYISCTEGLISSELYISEVYSLQGTSNNFEILMLLLFSLIIRIMIWKNPSILIWFINIHLESSLLNRTNRGTTLNRNPLSERILSAFLPVTNYLPWWRTMRHWTWSSRLAWYLMN